MNCKTRTRGFRNRRVDFFRIRTSNIVRPCSFFFHSLLSCPNPSFTSSHVDALRPSQLYAQSFPSSSLRSQRTPPRPQRNRTKYAIALLRRHLHGLTRSHCSPAASRAACPLRSHTACDELYASETRPLDRSRPRRARWSATRPAAQVWTRSLRSGSRITKYQAITISLRRVWIGYRNEPDGC